MIEEVGDLSPIVEFRYGAGFTTDFNPDVPNNKVAVKEIVRGAALEKRKPWERKISFEDDQISYLSKELIGRDAKDGKIFTGKIDDCPDKEAVLALLLPPPHRAYEWYHVTYWKLGDFQQLCRKLKPSGCLILLKTRVLLFSDEIKKLNRGRAVTPIYYGGLGQGYLVDRLETFKVINGCLYKVEARIVD